MRKYLVKLWIFLKIIFELLPLFDILDIANAVSRKVLVLEARNF